MGDLFVASHGSHQLADRKGYSIYRIPVSPDGQSVEGPSVEFLTGFLEEGVVDPNDPTFTGIRKGRPVDVIVAPDGALMISDDTEWVKVHNYKGAIWRVSYQAPVRSDVAGVTGTTTWTKSNSPFHVMDTVRVGASDTLTIEAGVDILFDVDVPLIVEGVLVAEGTENDSIRFLPALILPEIGMSGGASKIGAISENRTWKGLRLSGGKSSSLAYSRITGGRAWGTAAVDSLGGGVFVSGSGTQVDITSSKISGNEATQAGGGVAIVNSANANFINSDIENNIASGNSGFGGGIYISESSEIVITGGVISDNVASAGGGIYLDGVKTDTQGDPVLRMSLTETLIVRNEAEWGGGMVLGGGGFLDRCTMSRNVAHEDGGGLYVWRFASLKLHNSIVWGDRPSQILIDLVHPEQIEAKHSIVEDDLIWGGGSIREGGTTVTSVNNIHVNPLFVRPEKGDFHLLEGSPAIDVGDFFAPKDPDGTLADMGAFYFHQNIVTTVSDAGQPERAGIVSTAPNPYNGEVLIRYTLVEARPVSLTVFSLAGQKVWESNTDIQTAGSYSVRWPGTTDGGVEVASGVYIVRLKAGTSVTSRRFTLVR